ncbi:hypothetical protein DPMN_134623 [Dreissena polymorpha]|uniref:Uncharacterized protein n=1 Tax=Dreissena polymorpha TaxID=45954 RepID=A0A9D4FVY0_DREPO|nr:hypothetical protein DPMN_134623 [Dreissena polymorpha]
MSRFDVRAFKPNHFIPLVDITGPDNIFVTVDDMLDIDRACFNDDSHNEFNGTQSVVVDDDVDDDYCNEDDDDTDNDREGDNDDNYGKYHGQYDDVDQSVLSGDKTLCDLASKYDCVIHVAKNPGPAANVIHVDENLGKNSANDTEKTTDLEVAYVGKLENSFLETNKVIALITNTVKGIDKIPPGLKSNVYFVMNNGDNHHKRNKNKRSSFNDDCGVWDSNTGASPKSFYVRDSDGDLTMLYKRNGQFCTRKKECGQCVYEPFENQPVGNEQNRTEQTVY